MQEKERKHMSEQVKQPENKMGTMPVNKLLLNMAIPIMISMTIQALYNVVDSIFVGQVSQDALNAVSLALPIQNLMISVAVGTGVGINALLSRRLGQNRREEANQTAMNGIFLAAISYLFFAVLGVATAGLFYRVQTDITSIVAYGEQYLIICCGASLGIFVGVTMERLLQATGRTVLSMTMQGTGALVNLILDPILIFGLFGFPRLEVMGAAIATVAGQMVSASLGIYLNFRYNKDLKLKPRGFRPSATIIKGIYQVGVPSIIMSSVGSVMVFGMNQILLAFNSTATAVFGIYYKLQLFVFMPVFGLCNGMIPIVAYNYGAKRPERITKTVMLAMMYGILIMVVGMAVIQLWTAPLIALFQDANATGELLELGVPAIRTMSYCFIPAAFAIVASATFQALRRGGLSLIMSVVRQLVILLPAAYILAQIGGLDLVWWSFPIAEIGSVGVAIVCMRKIYIQKIKPLEKIAG